LKIGDIWKNIQELDLRPIREAALSEVRLAIVGREGAGKRTLAGMLRGDPQHPDNHALSPILLADLAIAAQADSADLRILLLPADAEEFSREQALLEKWATAGKKCIVFFTGIDRLPEEQTVLPWIETYRSPSLYGTTTDLLFLQKEFAPLLMKALPKQHLALGRSFPLLREPIARELINETCTANAIYSFGSGLAEIVPLLDIPLNVADMIVLTKAQGLLVYKLGLALGLSTDWQYYVAEFGSVIGSGFVWRQIARSLIGLVPVWGIVPKVAVAYSGTYVVGQAVLHWYLTGRHLSRKMMQDTSRKAFESGKRLGRRIGERAPKRRSRRRLKEIKLEALPDGGPSLPDGGPSLPVGGPSLSGGGPSLLGGGRPCPDCQTLNEPDAKFCKNCGKAIP